MGGRGIFGYSFYHPASYYISHYSSELFIQNLDFCEKFSSRVSVAQEALAMVQTSPFKVMILLQFEPLDSFS